MIDGFVGKSHVAKEKKKARELRKSGWWKSQLAQGVCYYCEQSFPAEELTMDHRHPVSRGGKTQRGNVVAACKPCNNKKKFYTPAELILEQNSSNN